MTARPVPAHSLAKFTVPPFSLGWLFLGMAAISWLGLMSPLFSAGPLVLDEHGSYWILDSDLPGTSLERSLDQAAIPPLSSWVQQGFLIVFGKSELVFRSSSALGLLGAIILCYVAGQEVGGPTCGGVAALLMAWHPEAMDEARIARCYGMVLFFGAALSWATLRWYRQPASWRAAAYWSLSATALVWTHYTSVLLIVVSAMLLVSTWGLHGRLDKQSIIRLSTIALFQILLCWPLIAPVLRLQEWGPFLNYSAAGASIGDVIKPWWWGGLPLSWLFAHGTAWILKQRQSGRISPTPSTERSLPQSRFRLSAHMETLLYGGLALIPLFLLTMLAAGDLSSLANPRYRVASAPAAAIFCSLLITSRGRPFVSLGAAGILLVIGWSTTATSPWQLGRLGSPADHDWYELNKSLASFAEPGEPILVQSGLTEGYLVPAFPEDERFLEYVACRVSRFYVESHHPRLALPFLWQPETGVREVYQQRLNNWRTTPGRFWVAAATDTDLNRNSLAGIEAIAQDAGFIPGETKIWPNATLVHYVTSP